MKLTAYTQTIHPDHKPRKFQLPSSIIPHLHNPPSLPPPAPLDVAMTNSAPL